MKVSIPLLAALALSSIAGVAQPNSTVPKNIRAANTLANLFDANGLASFDNLYGIPLEAGRVVGNAYLDNDWRRTTFLLYDSDKMIEGYPARYEIDNDQFEIKAAGGVKVLNGKKVKSFVLLDSLTKTPHYFVNGRDLKNENKIPLSGFFEVITEGELTLLAKTEVAVMESTYNEELDMGNRDTRIVKKEEFYYIDTGIVKELPSRKRKLLPVFGDQSTSIEKFIKINSLSLDEAGHLRALFEHYNSQVTN